MRWPQPASPETVVSDKPNGVAIVHNGVVAGDFFVDRYQHFFFANKLKQVTELHALSLYQLSNADTARVQVCLWLEVQGQLPELDTSRTFLKARSMPPEK